MWICRKESGILEQAKGSFPPSKGFHHGPDRFLLCWLPFLCRAWLRGRNSSTEGTFPSYRSVFPKYGPGGLVCLHQDHLWSLTDIQVPRLHPRSTESNSLEGAWESLFLIPLVDVYTFGSRLSGGICSLVTKKGENIRSGGSLLVHGH